MFHNEKGHDRRPSLKTACAFPRLFNDSNREEIMQNLKCLDTYGIKSEKAKKPDIQGMIKKAYSHMASEELELKKKTKIHANTRKTVRVQRAYSHSDSMKFCHVTPIQKIAKALTNETSPITLNINEHGVRFGGLASCDNPYCVFCASKRSCERSKRIADALNGSGCGRGEAFFLTFTIPRTDEVDTARAQLKRRWGKFQNKVQYEFRKKLGLKVSFAKSLDVTFNLSSHKKTYHLHYHIVMIVSGTGHHERVQGLVKTWAQSLGDKVDLRVSTSGQWIEKIETVNDRSKIAKYVAKMAGLGRELSFNQAKNGRGVDSIGLVDLMLLAAEKDPMAIKTYRNFLEGMAGARTVDFSRNWNDWITEEEEEEEAHAVDETIIISLKEWSVIGCARWLEIAHRLYRKMILEKQPNEINNLYEILDDLKEMPWLSTCDVRAMIDTWLYMYDLD